MDLNEAARKLQFRMGMRDFTIPLRGSSAGYPELIIVKRSALKIKMYAEDGPHKEPHIHIDYGKEHHNASYAIRTGERLAGNLDYRYERDIKDWVKENKDALLAVWNMMKAGHHPEHLIAALRES
jgi:hypothetical protein